MSDKEFVDGLIVKPPHDKAPDFVKCAISIKRKDLGNWLRGKTDDWINVDVKVSQNGKWYAEVNTWKPEKKEQSSINNGQAEPVNDAESQGFSDEIPF